MTDEDLARMNQVLRHRLRNMVSGVKSAVGFLGRELESRLAPEEKEYFPLILNECDSITELTNRLNLLFDAVPGGQPSVLSDILLRLVSQVRNRFPTAAVQVEAGEPLKSAAIRSDTSLLIPLQEVVTNALEAAPDRPVVVRADRVEREIRFRIVDQGPGVDEDQQEKMFLPFYTTRARHLGIGLPVSRRLLAGLGGRVAVQVNPGAGLTVELRVPESA